MSQIRLANKFKLKDLEVGLCKSCGTYYKMPFNPRPWCLSCQKQRPLAEKHRRQLKTKEMESHTRCNPEVSADCLKRRTQRLRDIRNDVKEIPVFIKPIVEPTGLLRSCLNCHGEFRAKTRFNRLCTGCNVWNQEQGMTDFTHYIGC